MAEEMGATLADALPKDVVSSLPEEVSIVYEAKIDTLGRSYATGRRKDAVARVWVKPGKGVVTVNDKALETYFERPSLRMIVCQHL